MFKKRYLPILKVLLLIIGITVLSRIEWYRAYTACRDELSSYYGGVISEEYQFTYQYTRFFLIEPVRMFFDDGEGGVWCYVRRDGLKWKVNAISPVAIYP